MAMAMPKATTSTVLAMVVLVLAMVSLEVAGKKGTTGSATFYTPSYTRTSLPIKLILHRSVSLIL